MRQLFSNNAMNMLESVLMNLFICKLNIAINICTVLRIMVDRGRYVNNPHTRLFRSLLAMIRVFLEVAPITIQSSLEYLRVLSQRLAQPDHYMRP